MVSSYPPRRRSFGIQGITTMSKTERSAYRTISYDDLQRAAHLPDTPRRRDRSGQGIRPPGMSDLDELVDCLERTTQLGLGQGDQTEYMSEVGI